MKNTSKPPQTAKRWLLFLPLIVVILLGIALYLSLQKDPTQLELAQKDRPVPEFVLADLLDSSQTIADGDLNHKLVVLNVWASWCASCKTEFDFLHQIATRQDIYLLGLNYRDKSDAAVATLRHLGNPFQRIIADPEGKLAMQLGVYGVPETYLINNGVIRFRYSGELTPQVWQQYIEPQLALMMDGER